MPESQQQTTPQKSQSNGDSSPGSVSTDSRLTPPESQSPLHWLADLAEQKAREEKQGNQLLKFIFKGCILNVHELYIICFYSLGSRKYLPSIRNQPSLRLMIPRLVMCSFMKFSKPTEHSVCKLTASL